MPVQVINGVGIAGIGTGSSSQSPSDINALSFISAATITDSVQKTAINELVLDLKAAGLWTKMKAIYPMVGGTASSHKWNLKDPRDLDAAYRLVFYGGWTHSSTGAKPNGVDGYADTRLIPYNGHIQTSNNHFTIYIRNGTATLSNADIISGQYAGSDGFFGMRGASERYYASGNIWPDNVQSSGNLPYGSIDSRPKAGYQYGNTNGLFGMSRQTSSNYSTFRNGEDETVYFFANGFWNNYTYGNYQIGHITYRYAFSPNQPVRLGAWTHASTYSNRENAFTTIGDGLTKLEMKFLYRIIEKFQNTLGRSIEPSKSFYYNNSYDSEVNDFLYNAGISAQTQINAVNTLVSTLKTSGIWSKMKAVYPMVGGTATSHSINLVNPGTYNLTFNGGWTHTASGATPNGTTGYANTNFIPSGILTLHNCHLSYYSRTSSLTSNAADVFMGAAGNYPIWYGLENLYMSTNNGGAYAVQHTTNTSTAYAGGSISNRLGLFINTRTSATPTTLKIIKNGVSLGNATTQDNPYGRAIEVPNRHIYLSSFNNYTAGAPYAQWYSNAQCAFASIGDGLTDAEVTSFTNAVQSFQTTLGRQV